MLHYICFVQRREFGGGGALLIFKAEVYNTHIKGFDKFYGVFHNRKWPRMFSLNFCFREIIEIIWEIVGELEMEKLKIIFDPYLKFVVCN